jgi:succinoglycan biosynthesis protein ExoA
MHRGAPGGGPMRAVGYDFASGVIADLLNSPLGVGSARYRYATVPIEADTVFLGAFRRAELLEAGGWDERFPVAEDMELSLRLKRATGKRFLVDPAIRVSYYPRNSLSGFARQYFRYGRYRILLARVHPDALRKAHLLPLLLLPGVTAGLLLGLALLLAAGTPWGWFFLAPLLVYALYALAASSWLARGGTHGPGGFLARAAFGSVCLGSMHFGWSAGAWTGLFARIAPVPETLPR